MEITLHIQEIEFDDIYKVWHQLLWKNRRSQIQKTSSMLLNGGYDLTIHSRFDPFFWGAFVNGELAGVNSGHKTNDTEFRSRGLYVHPKFRGLGIGRSLLLKACTVASQNGCYLIWSAPRLSARKTYISAGFSLQTTELNQSNGFEFGPNFYAQKQL